MKTKEQRRAKRAEIRWPAHVLGKGFHLVGADVLDVSAEGVFVRNQEGKNPPPLGTDLQLTVFERGWGNGTKVKGKVRWVGSSSEHRCHGMGIELDQAVPTFREPEA